jgi:hypothetical protein
MKKNFVFIRTTRGVAYMKKIVLVLLLLTLCLIVFASCTNNNASPERVDADGNPISPPVSATTDADGNIDLSQIYMFEVRGGSPYKFNVLTGLQSPICPDPLCEEHFPWSECVFSGIIPTMTTAQGEWLYFAAVRSNSLEVKDIAEIIFTGSVRAYNYLTREFRVLYSESGSSFQAVAFQNHFQYRDGYLYLCQRAYNAETDDYTLWSLTRVSVDTGRAEEIVSATPSEYAVGIGDALVFYDMLSVRGSTVIYKTDMSYQNRVDLVTIQDLAAVHNRFTYENYIYFHSYITGEDGRRNSVLDRINLQTGEIARVMETPSEPSSPLIIGDWIYFGLEHDRSEGRIYRVSAMGGEPEIYYEIPDFGIVFIHKVGKYIVAIFQRDGERDHRVIDTETGELVVY